MKIIYDKKNKEYPTWVYNNNRPEYELQDNFEFSGELYYKGFSRGRSALNIIWEDARGIKYYSGMSMLDEILTEPQRPVYFGRTEFKGLIITGKYTFKKQGTSTLLKMVK